MTRPDSWSSSGACHPPCAKPPSRPSRNLRRYALTRREYDILRRISMGETNPEIAEALGLTRNTVKTYVQSALTKLGARNRIEALNRLNELGLL
jgi:two-component system, NarL family, nitrate/nitrite response regulator NarL